MARARRATRPRSRAPPASTPERIPRPSRNACGGRPNGGASPAPSGGSCWGRAQPDLEPVPGTVPGRDADRRPVVRQGAPGRSPRNSSGATRPAWRRGPGRVAPHWKTAAWRRSCCRPRGPPPAARRRCCPPSAWNATAHGCAARNSAPPACAWVPAWSRPAASRHALEVGRDALDRPRRQRHHQPARLYPQRPLRRLLGVSVSLTEPVSRI